MEQCERYAIYHGELYHYGVIGMKWGVHRAKTKIAKNSKLERKALAYDKKSAKLFGKSEKIHAKTDLESANRAAKKSSKYAKKSATLERRSLKSSSEIERLMLMKKAENLKYKSVKAKIKSNRISKTKGYGSKAMKYSIKSDIAAAKAAKARKAMANNDLYVALMKKKVSSLSPEQIQHGYSFVNDLLAS